MRVQKGRSIPGIDQTYSAGSPVVCRRSLRRVLWHDSTLPTHVVQALWENPERLLASATMLKDGDRCTVVRLGTAGSAAGENTHRMIDPMVLKRYNLKGPVHTATHLVLRSRARWSWLNGRRLIQAGLRTPAPLACLDERRSGVLRLGSYLLMEFVAGKSLRDVVDDGNISSDDLIHFAQQFATFWQTLGQLRIGHGDMKATNFIVDSHKQLWLIDLDGVRVHRSGALLRHERRNDLARFMRNWQDQPEVAAIFRARIGTG